MTTVDDNAAITRPPLSEGRIIQGAITFADEHGLARMSMRKLAQALGYEVMSLYNHIANKEAIIEGMIEEVAARMPLPTPGGDWKTELRQALVGSLEVMQAHPWVVSIWNTRMPGPARMAHMEAVMSTLMVAGLSAASADRGFHALNTYLQGFALQQQADAMPTGDVELEAFIETLDPQRYPAMHAHLEWHRHRPADNEFEFALDLILNGLER